MSSKKLVDEGEIPELRKTRKTQNQHTHETDESIYKWIVSNCIETQDENNIFHCWIPKIGSTGIHYIKDKNQFRFSLRGSKLLVHVFTKACFEDNTDDLDVSHLCHNRKCCRPSHLAYESRSYNKSRDGCCGYIITRNAHLVCKHKPACKVTSTIESSLELSEIKD